MTDQDSSQERQTVPDLSLISLSLSLSLPPSFSLSCPSSMRAVSALVFLSVGVMVVLMYQAVHQELTLRGLKARTLESSSQVKQKENDIVQVKMKIQKLNGELEPINTKRDELTKKKEESAKATGEADKSLKTCQTEKVILFSVDSLVLLTLM